MQTGAPDRLDIDPDVVVTVENSVVVAVTPAADFEGQPDVHLPASAVLLPGLIDTHIHAPQWPQLGTGLDLPLEEWLFEYTFPLEARFADTAWATAVWDTMVPTLLAHGTTTAVFHGSIHLDACTALAAACADRGLRAFVGRVAMDHPEGTPDWYRDGSPTAAIEASGASIEAIRRLGSPLVEPILTPRFVPACTDELLSGVGALAESTGVRVQTHCSESDWEHQYVLDRMGRSDTAALDAFGLLRRSTVLAHADMVSDDDLRLMTDRGAGVAHCPLSNAYFANGVFRARRALDLGVHVGLGTDVAGGATPGLLPTCAHAVTASRHLEDGVDPLVPAAARGGVPGSRIDAVTAFWMATVGGASLLDIPVGRIAPGHRFDAIVVDGDASPVSALHRWDDDDARWFEKIVRLATPADITHVWVDGRLVAGAT